MNWIAAAMTMFVCSVGVYTAVRKAALDGISSQFNNLAMFAIPLPIFLITGIASHDSFDLNVKQAIDVSATAIVFAYTGNALSMRSIAVAANPGYSLMLSKSYVVFTTVWAVVFFDAPISLRTAAAIALILAASALIILQPRKAKTRDHDRAWILPAIGAFFCWGFLSLMGKHLQSDGMATSVFLTYLFLVVNICILIEMRLRHMHLRTISANLAPFAVTGVIAAGFNFFNFYAIKIAPNVGYVNATNAASIGAVTLVAAFLFKDELNTRKLAGVAGVLTGLLLLLL